jgi:hypothetical protein
LSNTLVLARPLAYLVLAEVERRDENYEESLKQFENSAFYSKDKVTLIKIN